MLKNKIRLIRKRAGRLASEPAFLLFLVPGIIPAVKYHSLSQHGVEFITMSRIGRRVGDLTEQALAKQIPQVALQGAASNIRANPSEHLSKY